MLAIITVALLVITVWGLIFVRRFGLLGGCLAVLFVGSCFGHAFFHANVGPIPVTLDRVLLGLMLVVYVVYRWWGEVPRQTVNGLDLLLLAFIGTLCFSTFSHDWKADGYRAAASLLFFYLLPLALYIIAREIPLTPSAMHGVFGSLAAFGIYLAVTAVLEQQQIWSLVFPRYIVSDAQAEFLGRGRGPFLNPVGNGMFLCAGLLSLLMFWPRSHRWGKLIILLLTAVYLAGIYCTLTRVVWIAAAIGLSALILTNLPRRWMVVGFAVCALVGTTGAIVNWTALNAFKRDRDVSVADMSRSASLRPILAYVAWHVFADHPLTGCGYRQYEHVSDYYLSDRSTPLLLERGRRYVQHNVFLSLLAETGMIGLGLFLLLWIALVQVSLQLWLAPELPKELQQLGQLMLLLIGTYMLMAMFHDLTLIPMVHMLMFFLAGLARTAQGALSTARTHRGDRRHAVVAAGDPLVHAC